MMPRRGVWASLVTGVKKGPPLAAAPTYQGRSFASRGMSFPFSSNFFAGM